jgi:hypothetical protein
LKEHHQAVAREVLERPVVLDDERADRRVVAPDEPEDLFRLRGLGERREVPEIAEHRGDLAAMAGQHRLAVGA